MRDPHVVRLRYRLETEADITSTPPFQRETAEFSVQLKDGEASLYMKCHHATVESAQSAVGPFLRAWEIHTGLKHQNPRIMRFVYQDCEVIDRNPPPPGHIMPGTARISFTGGTPIVKIGWPAYPEPPNQFGYNPDVETLWHRYKKYRNGQEPLAGMAYFCLTWLEASAGGRKAAASKYNIHFDVLKKLGELSSDRGDEKSARKKSARLQPYLPGEDSWVASAVVAIIRRMGEAAGGGQLSKITLADLPRI